MGYQPARPDPRDRTTVQRSPFAEPDPRRMGTEDDTRTDPGSRRWAEPGPHRGYRDDADRRHDLGPDARAEVGRPAASRPRTAPPPERTAPQADTDVAAPAPVRPSRPARRVSAKPKPRRTKQESSRSARSGGVQGGRPPREVQAAARPPSAAGSDAVTRQPAAGQPAVARRASKAKGGLGRRILRHPVWLAGGVAVIAAAGVGIKLAMPGDGTPHVITTPQHLTGYVQAPKLAASAEAQKLRNQIVRQSGGEVSHVIYAAYQGTDATNPPILLFIGGNLSGSSASSFISSFIGMVPHAVTVQPGSLGGAAACAPSENGKPAECAWADDDTFGLILSPSLSVTALGNEMRQMRPQVEQQAK
jgi:hypothetical protein